MTDKGLVMQQLMTLDDNELRNNAILESSNMLYVYCNFSLNLRNEKKIELLRPVLITFAVTPL